MAAGTNAKNDAKAPGTTAKKRARLVEDEVFLVYDFGFEGGVVFEEDEELLIMGGGLRCEGRCPM